MAFSPPLQRLIESFQRLPGIGPKTAQRLAFFVVQQPPTFASELADALVEAKARLSPCAACGHLSSQSPCELCAHPNRRRNVICVVAEDQDLHAIERTAEFPGLYHVLGGLISPLEGRGPEDLRIRELVARLEGPPPVEEIILALPPSIEGDTTSLYLTRMLKPLNLKLTRIAFGLPAGGELEYADRMTLTRALQGRVAL